MVVTIAIDPEHNTTLIAGTNNPTSTTISGIRDARLTQALLAYGPVKTTSTTVPGTSALATLACNNTVTALIIDALPADLANQKWITTGELDTFTNSANQLVTVLAPAAIRRTIIDS